MDVIQQKVISLLEGLVARFPFMSFSYGYDPTAQQHVVAVGPYDMYGSPTYMLAEGDVYNEWDNAYPAEDLIFVNATDPYHRVESPIRLFTGRKRLPINQLSQLAVQSFITVEGYHRQVPMSAQAAFSDFSGGCLAMPAQAISIQPIFTRENVEVGEYNYAMSA